jgi:S1-C subfamily serine protease
MKKVFGILLLCLTGLVGLTTEYTGTSFANERLFQSNLPDCPGGPWATNQPQNKKQRGNWIDCVGTVILFSHEKSSPKYGAVLVSEFRKHPELNDGGVRHGWGSEEYRDGRKLVGKYRWNVQVGNWVDISKSKNDDLKPERSLNDQDVIQISSGTGFAITNNGHIVTNNHVINGCSKVLLVDDGEYVPLKVLSNDPQNDLAVLKGEFTPTETFSITNGNPELMQDVYVSGYPFGRMVSTSVKVTRGIISSLTGYGNNFSGLQIDAAIQPGNSGGPIFDEKGNVVGVVVSKLAKQGDIEPENTNFGVKANILANLLTSNSVPFNDGDGTEISKTALSKKASDATFYLSCWNTIAEAKKMKTSKVMFSELD